MIYAEPQWYIFGYLDEGLVTQVGVLQRTITIGQNPLLIGGIGFLITEPEHRGRGFASKIMKEAMAFLKNELGLPFGLLTCKPRLESLYTGMGWRTIDAPNVFVQPTGNRSCGGLIMIKECGGLSWPEGAK
jgi:predicted acetyltransferase